MQVCERVLGRTFRRGIRKEKYLLKEEKYDEKNY